MRLPRPCRFCGKPGKDTCDQCRETQVVPRERARARAREQRRPSPAQRGYGAPWRNFREQVLRRDGRRCVRCGHDGDLINPLTVHHQIRRRDGGADSLDNCITLCKVCHGIVEQSV